MSSQREAVLLGPLGPPRKRTTEVAERLAAEIASGRLARGARLPTEQEMTASLGVSRTVVREAVAVLRAEGLVEARQGSGVFVTTDVQRRPFRIDPDGLQSLDAVLELMEMRTGIEVEAAGIAAERIDAAKRRAVLRALAAIDAAIERGEPAIDEDFRFHQVIAAATGNPHFTRFLEFLGHFLIPRQSVRVGLHQADELRAYLERIQGEHQQIAAAIVAGDASAARRAMRRHMINSRRRYRGLAPRQSGRRR